MGNMTKRDTAGEEMFVEAVIGVKRVEAQRFSQY